MPTATVNGVFPSCGHTVNIEEPDLFDLHVSELLAVAGWSA